MTQSAPLSAGDRAAAPSRGPAESGAVSLDATFQLLARAVRQVHTYPPASPFRAEAIEACRQALLTRDTSEPLEASVLPMALRVGDLLVGEGTLIETELARRLSRAGVAGLALDREVSHRDLLRFCELLLSSAELPAGALSLEDRLAEAGVDAIAVRTATRPALVRITVPDDGGTPALERERQRQAAMISAGGAGHLYPPDKGWIRVDPATALDQLSLTELAMLLDNPADLAVLLLRMTDDVPEGEVPDPAAALDRKYTEIVTLFGAMEPGVAGAMFARLARAVLNLPAERRQSLLRRSVLPGLLDGGHDGRILNEFPDVELAESLCLLLDVDTAAPELLVSAMDHLHLDEERRRQVAPLIEAELDRRAAGGRQEGEDQLDQRAARLVRVEGMSGDSLAEFTAFDLALTDQAREELRSARSAMVDEDHIPAALRCLLHLLRLEANPAGTTAYLARFFPLLADRWQARHWNDMAVSLRGLLAVREAVAASRPDVAEAITADLRAWCTPTLLDAVVTARSAAGPDQPQCDELLGLLAPESGPALRELIGGLSDPTARESLFAALAPHAAAMAPELAASLPGLTSVAARGVIRLLAVAGPGQEAAVGLRLADRDGGIVREALHALAQMGSPPAAKLVADLLLARPDSETGAAAIEALVHFPSEVARPSLRRLLGGEGLARRHPALALRLLDRISATDARPLEPELQRLARWPTRFWSAAAFRIRSRAQRLLAR